MYGCMYVYMCLCSVNVKVTAAQVHVGIPACVYVPACVCKCVHVHAGVCMYMQVHACAHIFPVYREYVYTFPVYEHRDCYAYEIIRMCHGTRMVSIGAMPYGHGQCELAISQAKWL